MNNREQCWTDPADPESLDPTCPAAGDGGVGNLYFTEHYNDDELGDRVRR